MSQRTALRRKTAYFYPDELARLEAECAALKPRRDGQFGVTSLLQEIVRERYRLGPRRPGKPGRRRKS